MNFTVDSKIGQLEIKLHSDLETITIQGYGKAQICYASKKRNSVHINYICINKYTQTAANVAERISELGVLPSNRISQGEKITHYGNPTSSPVWGVKMPLDGQVDEFNNQYNEGDFDVLDICIDLPEEIIEAIIEAVEAEFAAKEAAIEAGEVKITIAEAGVDAPNRVLNYEGINFQTSYNWERKVGLRDENGQINNHIVPTERPVGANVTSKVLSFVKLYSKAKEGLNEARKIGKPVIVSKVCLPEAYTPLSEDGEDDIVDCITIAHPDGSITKKYVHNY